MPGCFSVEGELKEIDLTGVTISCDAGVGAEDVLLRFSLSEILSINFDNEGE